jgi:hypothetical protein
LRERAALVFERYRYRKAPNERWHDPLPWLMIGR